MRPGYVAVRGSELPPAPGARVGPVHRTERATVAIVIRRACPLEVGALRRPLTRRELAARHGAADDDVAKVRAFAAAHRLAIESVDAARRTIRLSGTVDELASAFATSVEVYDHAGVAYRAQLAPIHVPADLEPIVLGVFGLDTRPIASPQVVFGGLATPETTPGTFAIADLARLYNAPFGFDGSGQTVAIIELGGGFVQADLDAYFGGSSPSVTAISVDGGNNAPTGDATSADGEVMLDIEIVGVVAPRANILVYFAPNSFLGFLDAVSAAIHDPAGACAVSISWGAPEAKWSVAAMSAMDGVFQDAAALGITVCVAAGDDGSSSGIDDHRSHVLFPASSPHVLACGGTTLVADGDGIASEVVWSGHGATGGGVSDVFERPAYQATAAVPLSPNPGQFAGRGVPDVAGDADPRTGYQVRVDGKDYVFGGTSAVAPLWAGLIARFVQYLAPGDIGFFNAVLYGDRSLRTSLHDITTGSNGAFSADTGWDPCTGWGTPDADRVLQVLATWAFARVQL